MTASFGFEPQPGIIRLSWQSDFIQTLLTRDGSDWPAGTVVKIAYDDDAVTVWTATVTGNSAAWAVDKTAVAALLTANPRLTAEITYSDDSGTDLLWYDCTTKRYGRAPSS